MMRVNRTLSAKECRVAGLVAEGLYPTEIGRIMGWTKGSSTKLIHMIMLKIGLDNSLQLTAYWPCELFQIGLRELGHIKD